MLVHPSLPTPASLVSRARLCLSPSQAVQPCRRRGRVLCVLSTSCCPLSTQPPPRLPPQFSRPRTRRAGSQTCPAPTKVEGVSVAPERELGGVLSTEKVCGGRISSPLSLSLGSVLCHREWLSQASPLHCANGPWQLLQPLGMLWGIYVSRRKRPAIRWLPCAMSPSRRAVGAF